MSEVAFGRLRVLIRRRRWAALLCIALIPAALLAVGWAQLRGWRWLGEAPLTHLEKKHIALSEDTNKLRVLTALLMSSAVDGQLVLANDGKIDLYDAVSGHWSSSVGDYDEVSILRSSRLGRGPTKLDIRNRDYTRLPWERHAGAVDLMTTQAFPLLWEGTPDESGEVLVALTDGSVRLWSESTLRRVLQER